MFIRYKYICGGEEDVERTLYGETTHNELFGRALTSYKIPEFSYPDSEPWGRSIGRTELFNPSYVPIVIIDTDKEFFVNATGGKFNKITFILKDNVFTFKVSVKLSYLFFLMNFFKWIVKYI